MVTQTMFLLTLKQMRCLVDLGDSLTDGCVDEESDETWGGHKQAVTKTIDFLLAFDELIEG